MNQNRPASNSKEPSHMNILKTRGYKFMSKINDGAYANVYLAEFVSPKLTTTKLAVKVLEVNNKPTTDDLITKFFFREVNILSQIDHPHIIHIHSILQIGFKFYIFMRFAEQGDLLDFILNFGRINEDLARVWTRQIALAIQYLHQLNIAHRDLKCENILVTLNYNVKLSDFGFARFAIDQQNQKALSSTYCGTLLYVSPEILRGNPYNPKIADLWSIGVVLYVMLNNSLPFDEHNAKLLYAQQMNKLFKFRSKYVNLLSAHVKKLVENLLEPDATKRSSIEDVINSEWIAMDNRLTVLSPQELASLSRAFTHPLKDEINLTIPNAKDRRKTNGVVHDLVVGEIKPYDKSDQTSKSDSANIELAMAVQQTTPG